MSVIPVWGVINGVCECSHGAEYEAKSPEEKLLIKHPTGKHPYLETWEVQRKKIASVETIASWFTNTHHNIAILTGKVSGNLAVMDFDDINMFRAMKHIIPNTMVVQTGKGYHVYIRSSEPMKSRKYRNMLLDFQADGKYVVAPPSQHKNGSQYKLARDVDIISLPSNEIDDMLSRAEKYATIIRIIAPEYKEGVKHNFNLGLAILCKKSGWNKDAIREFLYAVDTYFNDNTRNAKDALVEWVFSKGADLNPTKDFLETESYGKLVADIFTGNILDIIQDVSIIQSSEEVIVNLTIKANGLETRLRFPYEQLEAGKLLWANIHVLTGTHFTPTKAEWRAMVETIIDRGRNKLTMQTISEADSDANLLMESLQSLSISTDREMAKGNIYWDQKNKHCVIQSSTIKRKWQSIAVKSSKTKILNIYTERGWIVAEPSVVWGLNQSWFFAESVFDEKITKLNKKEAETE
jgi:hypothetical protein